LTPIPRDNADEPNRREFLANVGKGILVASVGAGLAAELGLTPTVAADAPERLLFGDREPLVGLMQNTPADKLLPLLVEKLKSSTTLHELVAAGALANARTFGGLDYEGHHAFAALASSRQPISMQGVNAASKRGTDRPMNPANRVIPGISTAQSPKPFC
jgi:hypothetical protein